MVKNVVNITSNKLRKVVGNIVLIKAVNMANNVVFAMKNTIGGVAAVEKNVREFCLPRQENVSETLLFLLGKSRGIQFYGFTVAGF